MSTKFTKMQSQSRRTFVVVHRTRIGLIPGEQKNAQLPGKKKTDLGTFQTIMIQMDLDKQNYIIDDEIQEKMNRLDVFGVTSPTVFKPYQKRS